MEKSRRRIILLGPQKNYDSLKRAIGRLGLDGTVALITAGWEEDECQDQELIESLPVCAVNLQLFKRSEQLFKDDPELIAQLQKRQDELRYLRDTYRMRLEFALTAARKTLQLENGSFDFAPECESAIEVVRQLDQQYFVRTSQVCDEYDRRLQYVDRPMVAPHARQIRETLSTCQALLIAGGHAAIILNRLRIFGLLDAMNELPLIAWSGGAMALAEQIVFFHDTPPQGPGNAEVLRAGVSAFHEVLPLPDARNRLNLSDGTRVALFARRFSRYHCVLFDETTLLELSEGKWLVANGVQKLNIDGTVGRLNL